MINSQFFLFFNDTATTEIYTLSLHDALPIYGPLRHQLRLSDGGHGGPAGPPPRPACGLHRFARDPRVGCPGAGPADRKSTRLNSSHANISYAVFCLKKKKHNTILSSLLSHTY